MKKMVLITLDNMKFLLIGLLSSFSMFCMDQELKKRVDDFYKDQKVRKESVARNKDELKMMYGLMVQHAESLKNLEKQNDEQQEKS